MNEVHSERQGFRALHMIQEDSRVAVVREIAIILISLIYILGSLLVWPYIFTLKNLETKAAAALVQNLPDVGGPGSAAGLISLGITLCLVLAIAGFCIFWFDRNYHPLRTFFGLLIISVVVSLVYTGISGINFIIIEKGNVVATILAFIVRAMLSCMLALAPALIFTGLTHLLRVVFNYRHEAF